MTESDLQCPNCGSDSHTESDVQLFDHSAVCRCDGCGVLFVKDKVARV
ncbi:MAG: hypothetical protein ABEJ23_01020 [Haloarculaceae archaeon]